MNQKRFKVAIIGTANWTEVAGNLFNMAGIDFQILDLKSRKDYFKWIISGNWMKYNVVHHVRGNDRFSGLVFKLLGIPVVWHWIGSDVLNFRKIWKGGGGIRGVINRQITYNWSSYHLADSPELANELSEFGINPVVIRLLPKEIEASLQPLPPKPAVLSYWNSDSISRDLYQSSVIMQLAASLPYLQFFIVGDDGLGIPPLENVKFLGRLSSLENVYHQVSIYIRLTKHDSLSAMVLESMVRGRYVIYSKPFPYTELAQTYEQARSALLRLIENDSPNKEGSAYVKSNFNIDGQVASLKNIYSQWFEMPKSSNR